MEEHLNEMTKSAIKLLELVDTLYARSDLPRYMVADKQEEIQNLKNKLESYL